MQSYVENSGKKSPLSRVGSYNLVPELSTTEMLVWQNLEKRTVILVWRGTDGIEDVLTDVQIALGQEYTTRSKEAIVYAKRAIAAYPPDFQFIFSGHSLGGQLAWRAFYDLGGQYKPNWHFVSYNAIVPASEFYRFGRSPRVTVKRTSRDIVSYKTPIGPNVTVKPCEGNPLDCHELKKHYVDV